MPAGFLPGQPYYSVGQHYRAHFGHKVYKVSVSVAQTCPNRLGLNGMSVCTFCDQYGSAAYPDEATLPVPLQIQRISAHLRKHYRAEKFLVYFQAYTNTFDPISRLEARFREALAQEDVVGLVLGTRPDCLPPEMLQLLRRLARETYVSVELGVQTLDDAQLRWLARGHSAAQSLAALRLLRGTAPELEVCVHLMFGLPGESDVQLAETALRLNGAQVRAVKLHNLLVLANTPLARRFKAGAYRPLELTDYARRVTLFLERLDPAMCVHRLTAVASKRDELIAPDWARHRMEPHSIICAHMRQQGTWQGRCFDPAHAVPLPPLDSAAPQFMFA